MTKNYLLIGAVCGGVLVSTNCVQASIITAAGQHLAVGSGLRTTTVPKPLDPDGDNAYGTAGWEFFGVGGGNNEGPGFENAALIGLPSFVSDVAAVPGGAGFFAAYFGYSMIDDPRLPIGVSVPDVISGLAYVAPAPQGSEQPLFRIVIGENAPAFRIGFLVNQEVGFRQYPSQIRLQSGVSSATISVDFNATLGQLDMYFFDVVGAAAGEVIDVFATAGSNRNIIAVSGITFDVIPAPGAVGMLALAGSVGLRRRR